MEVRNDGLSHVVETRNLPGWRSQDFHRNLLFARRHPSLGQLPHQCDCQRRSEHLAENLLSTVRPNHLLGLVEEQQTCEQTVFFCEPSQ